MGITHTLMPEDGIISGEYGQVIEHPMIRGLKYMVLGFSRTTQDFGLKREYHHYWALCIHESDPHIGKREVGEVVEIADRGWIIHE